MTQIDKVPFDSWDKFQIVKSANGSNIWEVFWSKPYLMLPAVQPCPMSPQLSEPPTLTGQQPGFGRHFRTERRPSKSRFRTKTELVRGSIYWTRLATISHPIENWQGVGRNGVPAPASAPARRLWACAEVFRAAPKGCQRCRRPARSITPRLLKGKTLRGVHGGYCRCGFLVEHRPRL